LLHKNITWALSFEKDPFHHILPIIYCMHGAFFELSICDCAWMVLHTRSAWNGLGAGGCSAACGSACGVTFFRHSPRDCALIRSRELYIEDETSPTTKTERFCGSSMQDGCTARFVASKLSSYDCPLALSLRTHTCWRYLTSVFVKSFTN
jgi:hypothetical protein